MHWRYCCAFAVSLALLGSPARGDDSNFRPYIVGGRAAGMGGAFTALADDGSGPFYNPGGLAFVDRSMLSLSASVYGLVRGSEQDALGAGHDFEYSDLNMFPVSTSAIMKYGDPVEPDGVPPNALALSVFVPDGLIINDRDSLAGNNQNAVFVSHQEQTAWVGGTYARRLGRLGIGASLFLLIGTATSSVDITAIEDPNFATITTRSDSTLVGLVGAVGLRYELTEELRLGLSLYTPELGVYGHRRFFSRTATNSGTTPISVVNRDDLHASPSLPFRVQAGVAWTSDKLTLTADVSYLGKREIGDDLGVVDQSVSLERRVKRNGVLNGAIGCEYFLGESFPLRAGLFTDFAASPSPPDPNLDNSSHVDRYGGSLSIGYRTGHTATDLGFNLSHGSGQDVAYDFATSDFVAKGSTQTLFYVFLTSSYWF